MIKEIRKAHPEVIIHPLVADLERVKNCPAFTEGEKRELIPNSVVFDVGLNVKFKTTVEEKFGDMFRSIIQNDEEKIAQKK